MPPSPLDFLKHIQDELQYLIETSDKLIHHYFGIDYELVWAMITEDAPLLKSKIDRILSDPE